MSKVEIAENARLSQENRWYIFRAVNISGALQAEYLTRDRGWKDLLQHSDYFASRGKAQEFLDQLNGSAEDRTRYRVYPDGSVMHQDDFESDDEKYDDYEVVSIPDELIAYIEEQVRIPIANMDEQFTVELSDRITSTLMNKHIEPLIYAVESLKRWKKETLLVLDEWEKCFDALPEDSKPRGVLKSRAVLDYITTNGESLKPAERTLQENAYDPWANLDNESENQT